MDGNIPSERITQILEEIRVVIPGTEVFLAFQLIASSDMPKQLPLLARLSTTSS